MYYKDNYHNSGTSGSQHSAPSPPASQVALSTLPNSSPQKSFTLCFKHARILTDELAEFWNLPQEDFDTCNPLNWWLSMLVRLYKNSAEILHFRGNYILWCRNILYTPKIFYMCPIYLFKCTHIFLHSKNIFMLEQIYIHWPRKHFEVLQKFIHCAEIFSNPQKHLGSPQNLVFSCADFLTLSFFGMPNCCDHVNDPLLAALALPGRASNTWSHIEILSVVEYSDRLGFKKSTRILPFHLISPFHPIPNQSSQS